MILMILDGIGIHRRIGGSKMMFDEIDNLLMNMSAGLLPEHLCVAEVNLLKQKYGENWFEKLGYTELAYKRPTV